MSIDNLDLSVLDKSIDDIEDLPGFEVPEPGIYTLLLKTSIKEIESEKKGKTTNVECSFETIECLEQADAEAEPTKAGTKFSTLHGVENEIGMGKLKEILAPVARALGETNVGKLVTGVLAQEGIIVKAKVKKRKAKKQDPSDEDRFFADVSQVEVAA